MLDNRIETVEQPWSFRADKARPDWLFFPRLHLQLGWGPGIRESFRDHLQGLRTVVIPERADISRPPLKWLFAWHDQHFLFKTRLRENAPCLAIYSAGPRPQSYQLGMDGLYKVDVDSPIKGMFPVGASPDFGVRHVDDGPYQTLVLAKRTRRLKAKYQERMKKFGLVYAHGTGKHDRRAGDLRTPDEKRFVEFITVIKREYVEKRVRELEKHPGLRPPNYDERRKAYIRSRQGEILRGKRNGEGASKRPYTEEQLTQCVCTEVARQESDQEMFDFTWNDVFSFSPPVPTPSASP